MSDWKTRGRKGVCECHRYNDGSLYLCPACTDIHDRLWNLWEGRYLHMKPIEVIERLPDLEEAYERGEK